MRHQRGNVLQRMAGVPILLLSVVNASADMIAPILPQTADIPCAKARYQDTELVSPASRYNSTRRRGHLLLGNTINLTLKQKVK
jgi:hypothetical protein